MPATSAGFYHTCTTRRIGSDTNSPPTGMALLKPHARMIEHALVALCPRTTGPLPQRFIGVSEEEKVQSVPGEIVEVSSGELS
jgi:hypothetical protein